MSYIESCLLLCQQLKHDSDINSVGRIQHIEGGVFRSANYAQNWTTELHDYKLERHHTGAHSKESDCQKFLLLMTHVFWDLTLCKCLFLDAGMLKGLPVKTEFYCQTLIYLIYQSLLLDLFLYVSVKEVDSVMNLTYVLCFHLTRYFRQLT